MSSLIKVMGQVPCFEIKGFFQERTNWNLDAIELRVKMFLTSLWSFRGNETMIDLIKLKTDGTEKQTYKIFLLVTLQVICGNWVNNELHWNLPSVNVLSAHGVPCRLCCLVFKQKILNWILVVNITLCFRTEHLV